MASDPPTAPTPYADNTRPNTPSDMERSRVIRTASAGMSGAKIAPKAPNKRIAARSRGLCRT